MIPCQSLQTYSKTFLIAYFEPKEPKLKEIGCYNIRTINAVHFQPLALHFHLCRRKLYNMYLLAGPYLKQAHTILKQAVPKPF